METLDPGATRSQPSEAIVSWLDDGTPYAGAYRDVYRSRSGAGQAQAVFVEGNRLVERWRAGESITVLETGFGLGLNCAATLRALAQSTVNTPAPGSVAPRPALAYRAIELHPVKPDDLARAHTVNGELDAVSRLLLEAYPGIVETGCARIQWPARAPVDVEIQLILGDGPLALAQVEGPVDAIFLDGFAPDRNPALWSQSVFDELARLARPGATLATYTVASAVRAGLELAGFDVERQPGFGDKRHRLAGRRLGDTPSKDTATPLRLDGPALGR